MALRITATKNQPELLELPWSVPLEEWPEDRLVALPRGISRHVVRFVRLEGVVYAVKEVGQHAAEREYRLLRSLERLDVPSVDPIAVLTGRRAPDDSALEPALVTRHLQFSLPYRALFSRTLRHDTFIRLLDALVALLVRLHLTGFYWGDCSLSNTLFRRDAGAFAAYLVDAETGEIHPQLSKGQREYDVELARTNIIGELMDLSAGGLLDESIEPFDTGEDVAARYSSLWAELTEPEVFEPEERYRLDARIRRLNDLGFDVAELEISTDWDGQRVRVQPKVVDAGHHSRRLLRLAGVDAEENQARRMLNDLDAYRAATNQQREDEEIVAHEWVTKAYEPVIRAVPRQLRGKLEPAEVFHEVLEHRWFMSEKAGRDVGLGAAAKAYFDEVLTHKPDERAVIGTRVGDELADTAEMRITFPSDD